MKRIIFFQSILYLLLILDSAISQQYYPFETDTAKWSVYSQFGPWPPPPTINTYQYFINGDTLIDSLLYSKIYSIIAYYPDTIIDTLNALYLGGLREDTNKYIYYKPGELFQGISNMCWLDNNTLDEIVLYRFDLSIGDTFYLNQYTYNYYVVEDIDSILVDYSFRRRYLLRGGFPDEDKWVEGIGSVWSLFGPHCSQFEGIEYLLCYEDPATFYFGEFNNTNRCTDFIVGNEELKTPSFIIFPNPTSRTISISSDDNISINEITIYNQLGQKVLYSVTKAENIDISTLGTGIFIVELTSNDFKIRQKLIIEE